MNTLLESYTEEMSGIPAGRVPENMLACNPRKGQEEYIWYNPPGKRQMFFHKDLNIQDGMFNLPGIVYHVKTEAWTYSPSRENVRWRRLRCSVPRSST